MTWVGPFNVCDGSRSDVVEMIASAADTRTQLVAFALHVGGLNNAEDDRFVANMASGDVVYADGAAVVWLARRRGAQRVQRSPTTDIGLEVASRVARTLDRDVSIALLGGPPGLADEAARRFPIDGASVMAVGDGYGTDWTETVQRLRELSPDILFVGMGMPREASWVAEHRSSLPPCIVMTCGGWFNFLAGYEKRAPRLVMRFGLEWAWRMVQQPLRLGRRYALGLWTTMRLARRSEILESDSR